VAPLLLAGGLLSAEGAIATTGFLVGYALFLDQGSRARPLARLLPQLLVVVVWQAVYFAGGYGVKSRQNSGQLAQAGGKRLAG
jgi:hypothetical protein